MKVTSIRTLLVTPAWTADPSWDTGAPFQRTAALIEVQTDSGMAGLGETSLGYFCPELVAPIVGYYEHLLIELGLDPLQPTAAWRELYQRSLWWGRTGASLAVLSGIEMALWDIAGKAADQPVHQLLGTAHARLPVYASGGTGTWPVARLVEQVETYVGLGFRAVKVGTGGATLELDDVTGTAPAPYGSWHARSIAGRVEDERAKLMALREAFGADIDLALDSHAVQIRSPWGRTAARDLAAAVEEFDLLFFEEPLRYDDPLGYAELRQATRVPIAGGECLTGLVEFQPFLEAGAFDFVQPDASHVGGIAECRRVAAAAEARHVGLIVHTGAAIGPGFMANVHVAFASHNSRIVECVVAPNNVRRELLVEPLEIVDGWTAMPTAPGLGVTLEPGFLDRYPFRTGCIEYA